MDIDTLRKFEARRDAAFWAWRDTRDYTPEDQQARDAYFEANGLFRLAKAAYEAALCADEARGEPNGH